MLGRLGDDRSLLEAGSLLPWLEMKIAREIAPDDAQAAGDTAKPDQSPVELRDRLIADQANRGISAADLSRAFNMRKAAIKKIIARLSEDVLLTDRAG